MVVSYEHPRLPYLNQVLELNPENAEARQTLYETMQQILRKDAFLAYEGETDVIYKVRTFEESIYSSKRSRHGRTISASEPLRRREQPFTGWDGLSLG